MNLREKEIEFTFYWNYVDDDGNISIGAPPAELGKFIAEKVSWKNYIPEVEKTYELVPCGDRPDFDKLTEGQGE